MPGQQGPNINSADFRGEEDSWDIVRWLNLLYEHRWWITGLTVFTVILAVLYSFLATPIYSATATIYVKSYSRQPMQGYNPSGITSWSEEEKFYNSQARIITSQSVMEEVANRLRIAKDPRFGDVKEPWKLIAGVVTVKQVRDSALFEITVTAPYKNDVAEWANTVAKVYRDKTLQDSLGFIKQANEVMLEEANKMQEQYVKQNSLYASSLQAQGSYLPKNQKDILDKKIEALELKINDVAVKESEVRAIVSQLQSSSVSGSEPTSLPSSSGSDSMSEMLNEYNNLVRNLSKLEVRFTPKHPEVIALKGRIAKQRNIILNSYINQLSALRRERANLQGELDSQKRQGLQFVEGSSRGEAMATSTASIKKYMDLLYDKIKELNVSSALMSSNIRLVNPALPPLAPVSPRKRLNILLGLILGLLLSAGTVVAYQFIDTSIKSVEDIESQLGESLLSMVPDMQKENTKAAEEAFQTLRIALGFASDNRRKNMLLFTSAAPQEGKTTVTVNLAKAVAETGERVLLVDCDLRRPSVPRQLNLQPVKKGLTNYLAKHSEGIDEFIMQGPHPNLFVLPSGPIPPNPPELFSMKRFRQLLEQLKQSYDWVFLDSPPFLSISDAQVLAGMCDMTVFITRFKHTKLPMVERSLLMLDRLGVSVAGIVLNGISTSSSSYYDYYYYNHYYYEMGKEPKRLPWMIGKVGGWRDVFRHRRR